MFEAVLADGKTFKHIIEAIKDLVGDCNLDCSEEDISIQSMDSAHVSLVAVRLGSEAFSTYRCDRPNSLGISTGNMDKILKMLGDKDTITFKAEDDKPDSLTLLFEGETENATIADFGTLDIRAFASLSLQCLFSNACHLLHRVETHGHRTGTAWNSRHSLQVHHPNERRRVPENCS
jgi:proliferating cell nuclear antigen PCNA